jgi:hypothetical protein
MGTSKNGGKNISKRALIAIAALLICALAISATTVAVISVNQNVPSSGSIATSPNIGVYSDVACTQNLTSINWGSITPGNNVTQTVYVKNTGTGSMTLSMTVSNWSPAQADTYLTITWNKQGNQLTAGQSITATLTLAVAANITDITNFSNTITISGTG